VPTEPPSARMPPVDTIKLHAMTAAPKSSDATAATTTQVAASRNVHKQTQYVRLLHMQIAGMLVVSCREAAPFQKRTQSALNPRNPQGLCTMVHYSTLPAKGPRVNTLYKQTVR
jgi:hypothetical protein